MFLTSFQYFSMTFDYDPFFGSMWLCEDIGKRHPMTSALKARDRSQEQLFAVNITLTPEGDLHREEVLALLFESVGHSGLWLHHGEPW